MKLKNSLIIILLLIALPVFADDIELGMTQEEVRAICGDPRYNHNKGNVWVYEWSEFAPKKWPMGIWLDIVYIVFEKDKVVELFKDDRFLPFEEYSAKEYLKERMQ